MGHNNARIRMTLSRLYCSFWAVALVLGWSSPSISSLARATTTDYRRASGRALNEIITTAGCDTIGSAHQYPARLDLVYLYSVEFYRNALLEEILPGVERAIATSVASTLITCSAAAAAQPMYAVELSEFGAHRVVQANYGTNDPQKCTQLFPIVDFDEEPTFRLVLFQKKADFAAINRLVSWQTSNAAWCEGSHRFALRAKVVRLVSMRGFLP
jgi:hypothetical protein